MPRLARASDSYHTQAVIRATSEPSPSFFPLPLFHGLSLLSAFLGGSHTPNASPSHDNDIRLSYIKMCVFVILALPLPIAASAVPLSLEEHIRNDQDSSPVSAQECCI